MSMVDPSIDYLAEKVDSKYTLVILAAKRARELTVGNQNMPQKEVSTLYARSLTTLLLTSVKYAEIRGLSSLVAKRKENRFRRYWRYRRL